MSKVIVFPKRPAERPPPLATDEIAEAFAPSDDDSGIPPRVAEQILDVIGVLTDRLERIESAVSTG